MAVFDAPQMAAMSDDQVRAVMMHELAYVVGLGHVNDRGQVMNAVQYARGLTELGSGAPPARGAQHSPVLPAGPARRFRQ